MSGFENSRCVVQKHHFRNMKNYDNFIACSLKQSELQNKKEVTVLFCFETKAKFAVSEVTQRLQAKYSNFHPWVSGRVCCLMLCLRTVSFEIKKRIASDLGIWPNYQDVVM